MDSDVMLEEVSGYIQSQPDANAMNIGWVGKAKDGGMGVAKAGGIKAKVAKALVARIKARWRKEF